MRKFGVVLIVAIGVAAIVLLVVFFATLRHWASVHSGTANESSIYYAFWSGFGADIGEATLITAVLAGVYTGARKVNCHTKGCWRIGHHPLDGTPYILCRHHHPEVPDGGATHEEILAHFERKKRLAARGGDAEGPSSGAVASSAGAADASVISPT